MKKKDEILLHRLLAFAADLVAPIPTDDTELIKELELQLGRTERQHWIGPSRAYIERLIIAARHMVIIEHANPKLQLGHWRTVAAELNLPESAITTSDYQKVFWRVKPEVEKRLRESHLI